MLESERENYPGVVVMFGIEGLDCDELLLIAFFVFGIIAIGFLFLWPTYKPPNELSLLRLPYVLYICSLRLLLQGLLC